MSHYKSLVGKRVLSVENVTTRLSEILDLEGVDSIQVECIIIYNESVEGAGGMSFNHRLALSDVSEFS